MAQLNWLDPSWDDDGAGLSSLERRQRKAAEKQDVLAFYSSLNFLFFVVVLLLLWSEIYAFATAPSRALTGAFFLELSRGITLALSQLRNLYAHVGHLAWTLNAVVYGADFTMRGVSVTDGAARLLGRGLYYLALALSGMVMYRTYPHAVQAPTRAAGLITLAAVTLFCVPRLYDLAAAATTKPADPVAAPNKKKAAQAAAATSSAAVQPSSAATSTVAPVAASQLGSQRHSSSSIPATVAPPGGGASLSAAATGVSASASKPRADSGGAKPNVAASAAGGAAKAAVQVAAAPPPPAPATPTASGGLFARITATVTSATAVAAPVLSGRAAKKAASAARKQAAATQPAPPPQYIIVQPPPPPRKVAVTDAAAAASQPQPVRNAWLNPNPVIKQAVPGKGPKGAPAAATAAAQGPSAAAAIHGIVVPPPPPPPPRQSPTAAAAAASVGLSSADPPLLSAHSSGGTPCTDPVAPPPTGLSAGAAIGEPVASHPARNASAATVAAGCPIAAQFAAAQLSTRASGGGAAVGAGPIDGLVSATIVTTDASFGPLVAHKHASGDLDISAAAANYRPYPSSGPAPQGADAESDSFSFFSIPPPAISDSTVNDSIAAMGGIADADGAAQTTAQELYSLYGPGSGYSSLTTFAADPVWNPNLPALFSPTATSAGRAPRVPPPGFPSHAYGGAFASFATGGVWSQHPPTGAAGPAATDVPAAAAVDALPLPPAGENGVLASLGFVEDGAADSSSGGGGDDGAGSCAICWSAPRQVGFLHGKTSHLCVCRRCAAQLREGVHRCPMCRQLIERIIDIF
ncbi:hypothetical protein GPECTOR_2g1377 [Gonium pectorale]|uniref:RING-type domain-containing protein n=1 Tax=Gonium pectorale TaxID=33097 RepID=A0A150H0Y5_GONPE|nr:hypothetical protein GPECTOR_2g1377 [Gonium pectorale]|eukprot:KXZ55826.1 hypothetical protein GPECTOR_2g1377 [Gonium pectorale]